MHRLIKKYEPKKKLQEQCLVESLFKHMYKHNYTLRSEAKLSIFKWIKLGIIEKECALL